MAIKIDYQLTPRKLLPKVERLFELSGKKILEIEKTWDPAEGAPVVTVRGRYSTLGWTEWTQGFQFGSALLQYEATEELEFLDIGRKGTMEHMAGHVSHVGVHDHGFNNVSTYGNLRRLIRGGKAASYAADLSGCEMALKTSGAVQASRWTQTVDGTGFVYSFNGPHSLFVDTIRSMRVLGIAHLMGHVLMGERDRKISLLQRMIEHVRATAKYSVYYGENRDAYDVSGRTAHEAIFNLNDGHYRCPNSQQGYSPFSTWTRGLAWAICGFGEQLEFMSRLNRGELESLGGQAEIESFMMKAAVAVSDFYLANSSVCGIPMWDTGAPNLHYLGDYLNQTADPYNSHEPVDSSAASIAAQGLLRLGNFLSGHGDEKEGRKYRQAGFTVASTLFDEPYLSGDSNHEGLILHSIYHRPKGWDCIHQGQKIPNGESSMWGDYHALELALMIQKEATERPYYTFFDETA